MKDMLFPIIAILAWLFVLSVAMINHTTNHREMIHREVFGTWQFHDAVEKVLADIAKTKEEKEEARKEWRDELKVIVTEICEQKGYKTQKRKADK